MADREVKLIFTAEGADRVSAAVAAIGKNTQTAAQTVNTFTTAAKGATESTKTWGDRLLQIPQALVHSVTAIRGAITGLTALTFGTLKAGDEVLDTRAAFDAWTRSMGGSVAVLQKLREATGGEIAATDLQRSALSFASRGVEIQSDELVTLFDITKKITDVTGRDFAGAIDRLSMAMSRGSISAIASAIGINNLKKSQVLARISAGDLDRELSVQETRTIALQLATERLADVNRVFGQTQDNLGDKSSQVAARFRDIKDDIVATITTSHELEKSFAGLATVFKNLGVEGETTGQVIGNAFAKAASFIIDGMSKAALSVKGFIGLAQTQIAEALKAWGFLTDQLAKTDAFKAIGEFFTKKPTSARADIKDPFSAAQDIGRLGTFEMGKLIERTGTAESRAVFDPELEKAFRQKGSENQSEFLRMKKDFEDARNRPERTPRGEIEVRITSDENEIRKQVSDTAEKIVRQIMGDIGKRRQGDDLMNAYASLAP